MLSARGTYPTYEGKLPTPLVDSPPAMWSRKRLHWPSDATVNPVFIEEFPLRTPSDSRILLYGARYELTEQVVGLKLPAPSFFVEFLAVECSRELRPTVHRLLQRGSVTYSEAEETQDYQRAQRVDVEQHCIGEPPVWIDRSEANWPTLDGVPMIFVGQVRLPDNDVTRTWLSWGDEVYLFWRQTGSESRFKIVKQDALSQTPGEHYRAEERRDKRKSRKSANR